MASSEAIARRPCTPAAAIVGTVTLRSVHLGRTLHDQNARQLPQLDLSEALYAALGRVGGGFGWHEPRIEPTPVIIPDDHYAWIFAHSVAIEPVEGVDGQQHRWTLPKDVAGLVAEREARARAGEWRPPAVDRGKRKRAMDDWGRQWAKVYDDVAWRLLIEAFWELQVQHLDFDDPQVERQFRQSVQRWSDEYGVAVPGAGLHIRVEPAWRKPMSNAEIAKRVKDEFKRLFEEGEVRGEQ